MKQDKQNAEFIWYGSISVISGIIFLIWSWFEPGVEIVKHGQKSGLPVAWFGWTFTVIGSLFLIGLIKDKFKKTKSANSVRLPERK